LVGHNTHGSRGFHYIWLSWDKLAMHKDIYQVWDLAIFKLSTLLCWVKKVGGSVVVPYLATWVSLLFYWHWCAFIRMKNTSIQLTQSVSQISTNSSASLSDDLLNTNKMTIESMIESTEAAICFMKFLDVFWIHLWYTCSRFLCKRLRNIYRSVKVWCLPLYEIETGLSGTFNHAPSVLHWPALTTECSVVASVKLARVLSQGKQILSEYNFCFYHAWKCIDMVDYLIGSSCMSSWWTTQGPLLLFFLIAKWRNLLGVMWRTWSMNVMR